MNKEQQAMFDMSMSMAQQRADIVERMILDASKIEEDIMKAAFRRKFNRTLSGQDQEWMKVFKNSETRQNIYTYRNEAFLVYELSIEWNGGIAKLKHNYGIPENLRMYMNENGEVVMAGSTEKIIPWKYSQK